MSCSKFSAGSVQLPANIKLDKSMFVGFKIKPKPIEYDAVFVDVRSKGREGVSGWMVFILGSEIFVAEDDMHKYFELIREVESPFVEGTPSTIKENKIEEVI